MATLTNPVSLDFVQGDTVTIGFEWLDPDGSPANAPLDLTGCTITSQIRKEYHTPVLASFTVVPTDLVNGKFDLILSEVASAALPARANSRITSFVFDVNVQFTTGTTQTPVYGYLKMQREVTR